MSSGGTELVQVYSTTPSIVGMRDALLLVIPVREDTGQKLVTVLNPVYVYMIALSGNPVNRQKCLLGQIPNRPLSALKFCLTSAEIKMRFFYLLPIISTVPCRSNYFDIIKSTKSCIRRIETTIYINSISCSIIY